MTWSDFLKYSKYIAVFYGLAFVLMMIGIWMPDGVNYRFIWSSVLCFFVALASNVALGLYHANHRGSMTMAKNDYLSGREEAQVITGEPSKELEFKRKVVNADLDEMMRDKIRQTIREERGY